MQEPLLFTKFSFAYVIRNIFNLFCLLGAFLFPIQLPLGSRNPGSVSSRRHRSTTGKSSASPVFLHHRRRTKSRSVANTSHPFIRWMKMATEHQPGRHTGVYKIWGRGNRTARFSDQPRRTCFKAARQEKSPGFGPNSLSSDFCPVHVIAAPLMCDL